MLAALATLPSQILCCVPWASLPLGRCALVYMDDGLVHSVHSPTLEQHLLDVDEVLEIRIIFFFSAFFTFSRQKAHFPQTPLSFSVDPKKVQSLQV